MTHAGQNNEVAFKWKFNEYSYYNSLADAVGAKGKQMIGIQYTDMNVDVNYEVQMVDLNALVSAVGGALGLFLGFSIIDSLLYFYSFLLRREL